MNSVLESWTNSLMELYVLLPVVKTMHASKLFRRLQDFQFNFLKITEEISFNKTEQSLAYQLLNISFFVLPLSITLNICLSKSY